MKRKDGIEVNNEKYWYDIVLVSAVYVSTSSKQTQIHISYLCTVQEG